MPSVIFAIAIEDAIAICAQHGKNVQKENFKQLLEIEWKIAKRKWTQQKEVLEIPLVSKEWCEEE